MKIEAGKYYRTRDGRKVGPAEHLPIIPHSEWKFKFDGLLYREDGTWGLKPSLPSPGDLIGEWADPAPEAPSPVRTTTKTVTEIVPGTYGPLHVQDIADGAVSIRFAELSALCCVWLSSEQLIGISTTAKTLADALDRIKAERQP